MNKRRATIHIAYDRADGTRMSRTSEVTSPDWWPNSGRESVAKFRERVERETQAVLKAVLGGR